MRASCPKQFERGSALLPQVYTGEERTELDLLLLRDRREQGGLQPRGRVDGAIREQKRAPWLVHSRGHGERLLLKGPAFGWAKLMPNIVGRGGPMPTCSMLTNRIAERLALPRA